MIDISFSLFVFSLILMWSTTIGKIIMLCFTILSLFVSVKKFQITMYHVVEGLFVLYVLMQVFTGVAQMPKATLNMAITMIYTTLFSIGMYNYCVLCGDLGGLVRRYANISVIGFIVAIFLYHNTIITTSRLAIDPYIYIGGIAVFGRSSSVSLAIEAVIPAFFIMLIPPNRNRKKAFEYVLFFALIALLSGTRKVLPIFVFIMVIESELAKSGKRQFKLLRIFIWTIVFIIISYILIMNVPILYNTIGVRIKSAIGFYSIEGALDKSLRVRKRMVDSAVNLYQARPFLGWGMDYYKYSELSELGTYSHNNFLELLSGGGLVGFFLYYLKYILLLKEYFKCLLKSKEQKYKLISCILFIVIMIIIEYWQVTYFYRFIMIYQVILLAIVKNEVQGKGCLCDKKVLLYNKNN